MTPFLSPGEGGAKTHRNLDFNFPNTIKDTGSEETFVFSFYSPELAMMHLK